MSKTLVPAPGEGDGHLREVPIESKPAWRGAFLDVRSDRVRLPDGSFTEREYIVHPGAVVVVGLLDNGRIVVERQWRYPLARAMVEFPAGKLEPGEPVLDCAVRELIEETGYRALEWARAGVTHNAIAYSTEVIEIWFARGLVSGPRQLDAGEFLDVFDASLDELEALACSGELTDAKTLVCMLWLRQWRDGRWQLDWQAAPGTR